MPEGFSRRAFLRGAGAAMAATPAFVTLTAGQAPSRAESVGAGVAAPTCL